MQLGLPSDPIIHLAQVQEALQNPDTMETQDMSDSQSYLSPVRPMQDLGGAPEGLHRGKAKSNLSEKECLDDTDNVEEIVIEEEEEEEDFDDDVEVEVEYQDNETIQILSDDEGECAMSPQKPSEPAKADEPMVDNIYARTYGGLWGQPVGPAQEMFDTQLDSPEPSVAQPLKPQPFNSPALPESQPHAQPSKSSPPAPSSFCQSLPPPPPHPQPLDSQPLDSQPLDSQIIEDIPPTDGQDQEKAPDDPLTHELEEAMDAAVFGDLQEDVMSEDETTGKNNQTTTKGTFKDM